MSIEQKNFKQLKDLAFQNKVCKSLVPNTPEPFRILYEPVCLPAQTFEKLIKISSIWQKLVHLASLKQTLVLQTFKRCVNDQLIGPLYEIYQEAIELQIQNPKPKIDVFRSDYFFEQMTKNLKLIQYNNHSVSMASISSIFQNVSMKYYQNEKKLLKNHALETIVNGIKKFFTTFNPNGILCYVSQRNESNIFDQIFTIEGLKKQGIPVQLIYFDELEMLHVDEKRNLFLKNQKISVVYFRAGYTPGEHTQSIWKGKKKVHLSNAVCIPWIGSELAGQKRMQAQLSKQKVFEKFLKENEMDLLKQSIIQTWDFNGSQQPQYFLRMMEDEGFQNFILKPNAEGGLNNFFGKNAYDKFKSLSNNERPQYILTKRIYPEVSKYTCITSQGDPIFCECSSELSIYGCIISDPTGQIIYNESDGFLIRTKPTNCDECGLLLGSGALSALQIIQ